MTDLVTRNRPQLALFFKLGFILFLILLLMIPNLLIQELVMSRQSLEAQTQMEIASSWGPRQRVVGPILSIPYLEELPAEDGANSIEERVLRILPRSLNLDVTLSTEERQKSIYKAILYHAEHEMNGIFDLPESARFGKYATDILWESAFIDIGLTAASSLDSIVYFDLGDQHYKMQSGPSDSQIFQSGIHTPVVIQPDNGSYVFQTVFGVNGSQSLDYLPIAESTQLNMSGDWDSPGFIGMPLPRQHDISAAGFTAGWQSTEYNRGFKKSWVDDEVWLERESSSFGVNLVQVVGHYQKNMRSAKYALLIISLSFMVFFFFEILKTKRIHPIQYIFVGLALSIFYTLLLSLSEHLGFDLSYLISAASVVGLISWYSRYILRDGQNTVLLTVLLAGLYLYIYFLLQLEEFALLTGSIGLFLVLCTVMYLSRHLDWYNVAARRK